MYVAFDLPHGTGEFFVIEPSAVVLVQLAVNLPNLSLQVLLIFERDDILGERVEAPVNFTLLLLVMALSISFFLGLGHGGDELIELQ